MRLLGVCPPRGPFITSREKFVRPETGGGAHSRGLPVLLRRQITQLSAEGAQEAALWACWVFGVRLAEDFCLGRGYKLQRHWLKGGRKRCGQGHGAAGGHPHPLLEVALAAVCNSQRPKEAAGDRDDCAGCRVAEGRCIAQHVKYLPTPAYVMHGQGDLLATLEVGTLRAPVGGRLRSDRGRSLTAGAASPLSGHGGAGS